MTIIPSAPPAGQHAQHRANYVRGLRQLADLFAAHDELPLLYHGSTSNPLTAETVYLDGPTAVEQALKFVRVMDEPPAVQFKRQSKDLTWLTITGFVGGLHLSVSLRAQEVCEQRQNGKFVVPDQLVAVGRIEPSGGAR